MAPPWASGGVWALPLESLLGKTRHLVDGIGFVGWIRVLNS